MNKRIWCCYIVLTAVYTGVVFQGMSRGCLAEETLVMASGRSETSSDGKALKLIFTEAFRRMGKKLDYRHYPIVRGSMMTDQGRVDGELARVYDYNTKHPNLVRVEEPIITVNISAFASTPGIKLDGWESLLGKGYRVEFVRGSKHSKERLLQVVENDNLSEVSHWSQGMKKLAAGRTDIFIAIEKTVTDALKREPYKDVAIYIAGVMEEQSIHTFFHEKHKALAPKLSEILKEMKQEGLVESYIRMARKGQELVVAFGKNRPPFVYYKNGHWTGFEIDIVRDALEFNGHTIASYVHMSNKRLEMAVRSGIADAAASVQFLEDGTFYSDHFVTYHNYAVSRKKDNITIHSIKDLTRYKTIAWQNAYRNLGAEFFRCFGPNEQGAYPNNYKEFFNQQSQNEFFWNGSAQVMIVDKTIFNCFRRQLSGAMDTSDEVVFHDIFLPETHYQVNFREKQLRDDFNEGLNYLRETGRYQTLIQSYIECD